MAADTRKPTLLDRAIAAIAPTYALERAIAQEKLKFFGYDAANPGMARGGSGGMSKNSSSETPKMAQDRLKLIWEARDLERNMPIIRCVLDRISQYVTAQVLYQSQSGDPAYDSLIETYWHDWCENTADITGRRNFRMLVELGFRSALRDGDFGFYLVRNGPKLQIQCIEADRIGDPNKVATQTEDDYIQGIRLNPLGQPVAYDIFKRDRKSSRYEFEVTADARNFFLLSKPLRTDEYRSVSWLAPVVGPARDLYEMFAFERGAAKWAASIAGVITVNDPLAQAGASSGGLWDGVSKDSKGNPVEQVQPNKLLRLRPNEGVSPFNPGARAAGAFAAYIEAAIRDIAMGLNVPYGFFDMSRFGGATVRLEAMQLQRLFERWQEILVSTVLNRVKRAVLSNAIALGELPAPPAGINFDNGRWQFGKHLTADTGYDTSANLELLQAGLKSASEIAGEEGYDFEDLIDQMVKEAIIVRDKCAAAGVPVEMVALGRFPDASNQLAAAAAAQEPPQPTVADLGDGALRVMADVLEKVAGGLLPRDAVVSMLVDIYELHPAVANAIVPQPQPIAIEANLPPEPKEEGEGKDDAESVDSEEKDK